MKVITEAILRDELRASQPESYVVPEGKILSPAAREYLHQRKIKIVMNKVRSRYTFNPEAASGAEINNIKPRNKTEYDEEFGQDTSSHNNTAPAASSSVRQNIAPVAKYVDYDSGAFYTEKPEYMTQLVGNKLVAKDHRRIYFRGKLDSLQSQVVLTQATIAEANGSRKLVDDLSDVLGVLREMMRCEILDEPFNNERIIGLNHAEIRERSHNPMKYFAIKQMLLPDYSFGKAYAMLNSLRTSVRETEVAAVSAFRDKNRYERTDIVEGLNRLSSVMHIMMCMYLAEEYKK